MKKNWIEDEIVRARLAAGQTDQEYLLDQAGAFDESELLSLKAEIGAEKNIQRWYWREILIAILEEEGRKVSRTTAECDPDFKNLVAEAKYEIEQNDAIATRNAEKWDFSQISAIEYKESKTIAERNAIKRFWLEDFYAVALDTLDEQKAIDFLVADCQGKRRSRIRNLENFLHDFEAGERDFDHNESLIARGQQVLPREIGSGLLCAIFRQKLGLSWFLTPGQTWNKKSEQVIATATIARQNQDQCRLILGIEIWAGMSDTAICNALLRSIDIDIDRSRQSTGDRLWEYTVDREKYEESLQICDRRADRKRRTDEIAAIAEMSAEQVASAIAQRAKTMGFDRARQILRAKFGVSDPRDCGDPPGLLQALISAA